MSYNPEGKGLNDVIYQVGELFGTDSFQSNVFDVILSNSKSKERKTSSKALTLSWNLSSKGFYELSYYKDFYEMIKYYCENKKVQKKYILIDGSPGIGKSTFVYFLIAWWYQEGLKTDMQNEIDTIVVQLYSKGVKSGECQSTIIRKTDKGVMIAVSSQSSHEHGNRPLIIDVAVLYEDNKIETFPEPITINDKKTFFFMDGAPSSRSPSKKYQAATKSIGADYQPVVEHERIIYAPSWLK